MSLAIGARAWLADVDQGRSAEIAEVVGRRAVATALARMGRPGAVLAGGIAGDGFGWAEARLEDETCVVGAAVAADGTLDRLIVLLAPAVPCLGVEVAPVDPSAVPGGLPILEGYFEDLMNSRFEQAASRFTPDTLYCHPPYRSGDEWLLFRGRDALLHGWLTLRGPSPARQVVSHFWQVGERFFLEGFVEGIPDGGSFFSTGQITQDAEIARYVAFYSARRIPSLLA